MRIRQEKTGHFMPPSLLDSQFGALEEPSEDEAFKVDANKSIPDILDSILQRYRRSKL